MSYRLQVAVSLCVITALGLSSGGALSATDQSIESAVKDLSILPEEYRQQVYASCHEGGARIRLFRHPEATRDDCKIDAVLIARKVIQLNPDRVKAVTCVFYDYDRQGEYWSVEVNSTLVKAFGSGRIGERELLDSLVLKEERRAKPLGARYRGRSYRSIVEDVAVVKGPLEDRRLALSLRLRNLSLQGVDTSGYTEEFLRVEDAARRGVVSGLDGLVDSLSKELDDRVQALVTSGVLPRPELKRSAGGLGAQAESSVIH